jgi:hypothetical protein
VAASSDTAPPLGGRDWTARVFSFPNPVDEVSARLVAGGVVLLSLVTIAFEQPWLTAVIAYGFVARVLTGPAYVLLGLLVAAATLESVLGLCLGCKAFAVLMRAGPIPGEICERCNNIRVDPSAPA